jgi:phenylalanyl-tRNA synthetase beta chain
MPEEKECLCILGEDGFLSLKGIVEAILSYLNIAHRLESTPYRSDLFSPEKSAELKLGGNILGYIGELSSDMIKSYDFRSTPCITELNFDLLMGLTNLESSFQKIPLFPTMERDLAIVSDEKVTWGDIKKCIELLNIDYLDNIEFFDVYRGKQVEKGKKSIAFRLIFRADDRTLKSEEVDALQEKILDNLNNTLGVILRT